MEKKQYLEIAKIINTHGVAGELKLECRCDSPAVIAKIKNVYINDKEYSVERCRAVPNGFVLMKLSGINDLDEAMKYKNRLIYAKREDIPKKKSSHFICDLLGLEVIDAVTGKVYGTLEDIQQVAVQEIMYIKTPSGTVLMPNVPEFVKTMDEDKGIFVTPIPGFFDGAEESDEN